MSLKLIVGVVALLITSPAEQAQTSRVEKERPAAAIAESPTAERPERRGQQRTAEQPESEKPAPTTGRQKEFAGQSAERKTKAEQASQLNVETVGGELVELLPIEANIISYTNQERGRYGLPPLKVDRRLMASARRHCAWMTRNRSLVHTSQPVAENIAMGQRSSREAVRDWMASPGHRANILNRSHRRIGVAAYRTPGGTIFWCQQFGR